MLHTPSPNIKKLESLLKDLRKQKENVIFKITSVTPSVDEWGNWGVDIDTVTGDKIMFHHDDFRHVIYWNVWLMDITLIDSVQYIDEHIYRDTVNDYNWNIDRLKCICQRGHGITPDEAINNLCYNLKKFGIEGIDMSKYF